MNQSASKKLYYLYFLMTIMIIGIHSVSPSSMGFEGVSRTINEYMRIFFDAATGSFFCFSAYLLYRRDRDYLVLLKNKIRTLVIPYLLFNIFAFLYKDVLRSIVLEHAFPTVSLTVFVRDILLSVANPPLWFIRVLFEFVILYPLIKLVTKNKIIAGGVLRLQ